MPPLINRISRMLLKLYPFPVGTGRLIDRSWMKRLRFDESTMLVPTSGGFTIRVIPNDLIGRHIYLTGEFDHVIVGVLLAHSRPGDRILDIGANIGYVACSLLHRVPDSRVVCVEPQPPIFDLLVENLNRIDPRRGKAIQAAISDHAGVGTMQLDSVNCGASRLIAGPSDTDPSALLAGIRMITAEQLMSESGLDGVDLIKIDVEGHEVPVMQSLQSVINRHRPRAILFEHDGDLQAPTSIIGRIFSDANYRLFGIRKSVFGWKLIALDKLADGRAHDYIAKPA